MNGIPSDVYRSLRTKLVDLDIFDAENSGEFRKLMRNDPVLNIWRHEVPNREGLSQQSYIDMLVTFLYNKNTRLGVNALAALLDVLKLRYEGTPEGARLAELSLQWTDALNR